MGKFYAVKVGATPGIYNTWAECEKQIKGFSGAVFKSFTTLLEAEKFIGGEAKKPGTMETECIAYVDGSYDKDEGAFSCGVVLFHNDQEIHLAQRFTDEALISMHNVAGEIKGAELAIQYCLEHGIKSVTIYHDYEGIAKWCVGDWKAKQPGTIAYVEFYKKASTKLEITFVKVKGHSGDTYNELADHLAKEVLRG